MLGLGLLIVLGLLGGPRLLWVYNLQYAGQLMEQGLRWPEPRLADSRPESRDERKLEVALSYISAAIKWLPNHPYAYRQAAQIYNARKDWLNAAEALGHAMTLDSRNPLIAWERALVYEQMWEIVRTAPFENLLPDLVAAPIDAPNRYIDTPFCKEGKPQTCYVGMTTWVQPYVSLQDGPSTSTDVLFMHPPARIRLSRPIQADHPVLHFLIGFDPIAREYGTDGATFQVWVRPAHSPRTRVFERTVDSTTAAQGWVAEWVDLSQWSGQTVTLELQTIGGPAGDTTGDWAGWGNVILTTSEAAQNAVHAPKARMEQAWHQAGEDAARFIARGDLALNRKHYAEAASWYSRATDWKPSPDFGLLFRSAIAAVVAGSNEAPELLAAVRERDSTFTVFNLEETLTIDGRQFRWMSLIDANVNYGMPLQAIPQAETSGFLWFSGEAVAVLWVEQSGSYRIQARSRHGKPEPIEVALSIGGALVRHMSLDRGDDSLESIEVPVTFRPGFHTLHFSFLNDSNGPGWDRNAELISVEVRKVTK